MPALEYQSAAILATQPDCAGLLLSTNLPVLSVMIHLGKAASLLLPANPAQVQIPDLGNHPGAVRASQAALLELAAAARRAGAR